MNGTQQRATALQEGEQIIEREITGAMKWYDGTRGFGFVTCDDGRDVFVHHTGLATKGFAKPTEGQRVTFDIANGKRGLKAVNLTID
jgi:CspA family cold shock protein